jgi:hypothetical protein
MSTRVNPFANLSDPLAFTTKPKKDKPVDEETIAHLAEQNEFPSRQPARAPKELKRKPRIHRTLRHSRETTHRCPPKMIHPWTG